MGCILPVWRVGIQVGILNVVKDASFAFESNLCNEKSVLNKGIYSHTSPLKINLGYLIPVSLFLSRFSTFGFVVLSII